MFTDLIKFLKECGIKQVSISAIIAVFIGIGIAGYAGDQRYQLKTDAKKMQRFQEEKMKVEILLLDLQASGASQAVIDKKRKEEYQRILDEMNK